MKHIVVPTTIRMSLLAVEYPKGGAYEKIGERGTSHLMEHLMIKTFDAHRETLKGLGIDYNAYTDNNQVVFWWSGLDTSINEMAQTLYEGLTKQRVLWTKEAFENEKKTVLQEYGDTFNDQGEGFFENTFRKYYNYTSAIGYREDIESFDYEMSLHYAKDYMKPRLVCEVGKSNLSISELSTTSPVVDRLVYGDYEKQYVFDRVPKEDKTLVGLLGKPFIGNTAQMNFVISCLTGGLESPLYQEIRGKRGLSYFSSGFTNKVGNQAVPFFYASTGNEREAELARVYEGFFIRAAEDCLSEDRFNTCFKNLMIKKEMAEILPHAGAKATVIGETNPFDGMDTFTYADAIQLMKTEFAMSNLQIVSY